MIETKRLNMRPWEADDAETLFKYASEPRVSEPALWPCHSSVEMSRWVIENIFRPNPQTYALVLRETMEPVGCIGLVPSGDEHFPPEPGEREVGYWIGLPYWSQGLTTKALIASQRVAEKSGFTFLSSYSLDGLPSRAYRLHLSND